MARAITQSRKNILFRWSAWLHKWAGLLLGLQVLFWIAGGLIMSAIPLEKVHGKHLASATTLPEPQSQIHRFSLDSLLTRYGKGVTDIQLNYRLGQPVYVLQKQNDRLIINATTGEPLNELNESDIRQLAHRYYLGDGKLQQLEKLMTPPHEASRAEGVIWRANFDDIQATSLYIQPDTGELVHVRSDIWRLFDFVWMLHIMDYDTRDDFNNPILISFAAGALLFTLSGLVLLYRSFAPMLKHPRFKNQ